MMRTKIKSILASLALVFAFSGMVVAPVAAQGVGGQAKQDVCAGVNAGGGSCSDTGTSIGNVLKLVANILSIVAGVAAVIMIIVGGLKYITSGGDSSKVASAKSAIIYAIVGLVIVALAQILVAFVLSHSSGNTTTV